jgi:pyruvate ferredoxin oxidoreductase beta subunit
VSEFLKPQKRFAHVFKAEGDPRIARLQALADRNIAEYRLLEPGGEA